MSKPKAKWEVELSLFAPDEKQPYLTVTRRVDAIDTDDAATAAEELAKTLLKQQGYPDGDFRLRKIKKVDLTLPKADDDDLAAA